MSKIENDNVKNFLKTLKKDIFEIKNKRYRNKNEVQDIKRSNEIKHEVFDLDKIFDQKTRQEQIKKISFFIVKIDNLRTNQIRKFLTLFNKVMYKLEKMTSDDLNMELRKIQNLIVYYAGKSNSVENFGSIIYRLLEKVVQEKNDKKAKFNEIYEIIEGIIAHHKYFGGRD
ncbi:MAG: type III-A CRISPR-associated protein Csm2 [Promethearchaeota archaeon]